MTSTTKSPAMLTRSRGEGPSLSPAQDTRGAQGKTGKDLLAALAEVRLSEAVLDAIEEQVAKRQASPAGAPHL
jgi:hypothetical protein